MKLTVGRPRSSSVDRPRPPSPIGSQKHESSSRFDADHTELDVRIGDRVVRRLLPGDSLGEVALIREVPRTASIVAVSEARLLAMDRADFLEAVDDSRNSRERAESTGKE